MSLRVLLVGPPDPHFEDLKAALEQAGFLTKTAANGIDGLKAGCDFRPHLVISEVVLSGMDGLEFCSRISKAEGFHTQVIFYSRSYRDAKSRGEIIHNHGALHYFVNPFQKGDLWEAVTNSLNEMDPQNEKVKVKGEQALSQHENSRNLRTGAQWPVETASGAEYGTPEPSLIKTTTALADHSPPPPPKLRKLEVPSPISESPPQVKTIGSGLRQTETPAIALESSFLVAFENKARSIPKLRKMMTQPGMLPKTKIRP